MASPVGPRSEPVPSSEGTNVSLSSIDAAVKNLASALTMKKSAAIDAALKAIPDKYRPIIAAEVASGRTPDIHKLRAAIAQQLPATALRGELADTTTLQEFMSPRKRRSSVERGSPGFTYMNLIYRLAAPGCTKAEKQIINGTLFRDFRVDLLNGQYIDKKGGLHKAAKLPEDADGETIFRTAEEYSKLKEGSAKEAPASTKGAFERLSAANSSVASTVLRALYDAIVFAIESLRHALSLAPKDFTYRELQGEIKALEAARTAVMRLSDTFPLDEGKIPEAYQRVETPFADLLQKAKEAKTARALHIVQDHFLHIKRDLLTQLTLFLLEMSSTEAAKPLIPLPRERLEHLRQALEKTTSSTKVNNADLRQLERTLGTLLDALQLP